MSRQLSVALVDRVVASYPLPVADAVAALVAAESVHEERDRVVEVFRVALRWLALLALAARGQYGVGDGGEGPEVVELLGTLRRRGLTDGQWVALLRGVARPWTASRHPLPGLVRVAQRGAFWRLVDGFLEMRRLETVAHGATGDDQELEALLGRRVPQLSELLEVAGEAWEGLRLVVPGGERRGRSLMGCTPPRGRFRRVELRPGDGLAAGEPVLVDGQGKPVLALAPLALFRRGSAEGPEELFTLDGPGRRGVLYVALPSMAEHVEADGWPALESLLFGRDGAQTEDEVARPYRGLESFGPEHVALFFGREEQAEALSARVRRSGVLTVTGPSGSGKTSLLRAGVAPRLRDHLLAELRPGADPLGSLARALARLVAEEDAESIGAVLRRSPEAAGHALGRWCQARERRLLILVDQAEELFTLCADARARAAFGRALVACAGDGAGPLRVVLVVREDFFARLATIEALQGVYSRAVEVVTTPDRAALARAVAMPAWRFGYSFDDPSLVDRMVDAAAGEPSALALLQFCADRLWEARDRRWKRITADAYEAIGGVEGALAAHAERTLRDLTPAQQGAARVMLRRLVTAEGTRALCSRGELLAAAGEARDGHVVLERLVEARLVVAREEDGGQQALELVHEALLRHWERLRSWQEQDREEQRRLDLLRRAAREWDARGRPRGLLWRDEILGEHRLWRRHTSTAITDLEEDFLEASEAEESRASRFRRAAMASGLGVLMLSSLVMAVQREEAVRSQQVAEQEKRRAELSAQQAQAALRQSEQGRLLAEAGRRESLGRPGEAVALLRASASLAVPAAEPLLAELHRLASLGDVPLVLQGGDGPVLSLAYTPDGRWLVGCAGAAAQAWSLASFRPRALAHQSTVWAASPSPDGALVLSASADQTAALWRLSTGERVASMPHPAEVQAAAFSPDGRWVATGAADGVVRLFGPDGAFVRSLTLHQRGVSTLAFSPDSARLAAGSRDRTASLWSLADGSLVRALGPFDDPVSQVAFSPDGASLALVHKRTVELVDGAKGERRLRLDGHEHLIHALAFSPDSGRLVTASSDRTARVWSTRSGEPLRVLGGHDRAVLRALFAPDGRKLATASADGVVRLHDASTGVLLRTLRGGSGVGSLAFSPDGTRLAAGSRADDGVIYVWDVGGGASVTPLRGHGDDLYALAFSPDGSRLATASKDRSVRLWEVASGAQLHRLDHREPAYALAFSPDGAQLATASYERAARLWAVASGKLLSTLSEHEGYVPALAFSPDGRRLATASVDRRVRLYDAASGKLLEGLGAHDGAPFGLAFDAAGRRLATLADDGKIRFFDLSSPASPPASLPAAAGYAEAVAHASGLLAAGASDGSATVWDVARGAVVQSVRGHDGAVLAVALSRDGRWLVTGSADQSAAVWRLDSGAQVAALAGHGASVLAVALSPDASLVATGSADRTIRLWSLATGQLVSVLGGHDDKVSALAFSPDGRLLASASHDDTARLWALSIGQSAPRPFTDLGARSNLRVCRDSGEVVAVLPPPLSESVWAPPEACRRPAAPGP